MLIIPTEIQRQLARSLATAGKREIGGILMGEHVGPDTFRVSELTVQAMGAVASFVRTVTQFLAPLEAFFKRTRREYQRFNYLGEWHSHPMFTVTPSSRDHQTMQDIVDDPRVGARFAVLLVVRLQDNGNLEGSVTVHQPGRSPRSGSMRLETGSDPSNPPPPSP